MKYLILLLTLASCAEIQKATNVNALSESNAHYNGAVKALESESAAGKCKFISNVTSEDNLVNPGKESAITSMKKFATDKGGDSVLVGDCTETKTAIQPITTCKGKVYKCN